MLACGISKVPNEIWVTFTFTFVIGAFLFGGGIYLVYNGTMNKVTDFVVLGGCGTLVGICFISVGSIILLRPIFHSRKNKDRKRHQVSACGDRDSLLPSPFVDDNKRVGTHQQTNGHRNVFGSSQVSENEPVVKSRDKNTYPRGNIYEILPRAEAPLHTCAHNNQVVEPNKKRSRTTESTLGMSKVSDINFAMPKVEAKTDIFNHRPYQKENMNQISIPASNVMKQWQTTVAKMSPQSTSSKPTSDSDNSFNKSITVVVAEVHAEPGRHCSFSQHSALLRCDRRYNNESLLTTSALTSDEEADVSSPKDECSGDSESRSDTGIGQSMSEDEFTFIKDETSLSRRINEREDSNDALSMMLINDCLLFEDDDDVDHEFILNRCHVMAEVLVHSG